MLPAVVVVLPMFCNLLTTHEPRSPLSGILLVALVRVIRLAGQKGDDIATLEVDRWAQQSVFRGLVELR